MAEFESGGTSLATLDARFVNVTGDTLTGALTLAGAPTVDLHASTKLYVDEQLATTDTLAELGDVTLTGLSGNNLLQYDSSSSRWVNRTLGAIADNRYVNIDGDTMTGALVLPSLTLTDFSGALSASGGVVSAGTLSSANGGTGISSYTIGDLLYASGATTLARLADVATGSVLVSGGVGVAPSWSVSPTITSLLAVSDDSGAIGASGTAFSDLFLASGAVINIGAGNVTLTQSANALNLTANSVNLADLTSTGYVFNEGGADIDMRWEGDTDANTLVLDAGLNAIILGALTSPDTLKLRIVDNATDTYGLLVDRYSNLVTNTGTGITYAINAEIDGASSSGTTAMNLTAARFHTDQRRTFSNLSAAIGHVTRGFIGSIVNVAALSGTSWTAGIKVSPSAVGAGMTVQDYVSNTSNTTDSRPDTIGGDMAAVVVSYTINNAGTFMLKTYYGVLGTADHRGGTLTAGSLTKPTYGGYFQSLNDTVGTSTAYGVYGIVLGADTNYAGYFGGPTVVVDLNGMAGTLSVDRGIIGNETGIDSDSRFESNNDANCLFIDGGTDSVGIGVGAPDTKFEVQTTTTWGSQAITIDQDDADQAFIDYQGTSSADLLNNISTFTTEGGTINYIKVEINGSVFWIRAASAPTA